MRRTIATIFFFAWCAAALGQGNAGAGEKLYAVCAGCHGFRAEGSRSSRAPTLAGMEDWYLARQLEHFQRGLRGASQQDLYGAQMARTTLSLWNQRDIEDVTDYITRLPATTPEPTVQGDAARGRERYLAACSPCHGARAEGMAALGAPKLAGLDDWYVVAQLALFKEGLRGAHSDDAYGQQMRPFAAVLDEQLTLDVVTHLNTLANPKNGGLQPSSD